MKIKNEFEMVKSVEDVKTALMSIAIMPPARKEEFFNTPEGKYLLKGIQLLAENNKPANKEFGMSWSVEDIEQITEAIKQADVTDTELIMTLLPGPIASIVFNKLNEGKVRPYSEWTKIKDDNTRPAIEKAVTGMGRQGPKKGTPQYEKWLESRRAKKIANATPDVMTRPTKTRKTPFKHFIRRVKDDAKIVDTPTSSEKSEKSY